MPSSSSKGKPTNQELHDKITEEVKQQTNKDGALHLPTDMSGGIHAQFHRSVQLEI